MRKRALTALLLTTLTACGSSTPRAIHITPTTTARSTTTTPTSSSTTTSTTNPNAELVYRSRLVIAYHDAHPATLPTSSPQPRSQNEKRVHTDAWWHAISICEQGGRNDNFFGYFSLMDGSAGGGKSWATQVAMAQRIIDRAGDHAWASKCVSEAYGAAPNG